MKKRKAVRPTLTTHDTELRCYSDVSQLLTGVLTLPYTVILGMSIAPTAPKRSAANGKLK